MQERVTNMGDFAPSNHAAPSMANVAGMVTLADQLVEATSSLVVMLQLQRAEFSETIQIWNRYLDARQRFHAKVLDDITICFCEKERSKSA